jgi:hypothetical protein
MKYTRLFFTTILCIYFWECAKTYTDWHFIDSVNLIFHEAGHSIFFFLGQYIQIAAGSGFQIALPLFISLYFFAHNQKTSGSICLLWVGQNLLNVSVYAGDAIKMDLPLLGGDNVIHDWNYLLDTMGILKYTNSIAGVIYFIGICTITLATILSLYYVWQTEN